MSISTELQRIKTNISDSYTAAASKGATIPANQSGDNLATTINSIVPAGVNPQNRTAYESGTYTYENGQITYGCYGLNVGSLNSNDRIFVKEPVAVGSVVYDSLLDSNTGTYSPNFNRVIGSVYKIENSGSFIHVNDSSGGRQSQDDYVVNVNYDSLNSVIVDTNDIICLKPVPSVFNSSVPYIAPYAFIGNKAITSVNSAAEYIGYEAFMQCQELTSITLTKFEGGYLDSIGRHYITGGGVEFGYCNKVTSFSAPNLKIATDQLLCLNDWSNVTTFNVPNLIGMENNSFGNAWAQVGSGNTPYEVLKRFNIDITDFEYMGYNFGGILEQYIADVSNNITDTLNFPKLRCMAGDFTRIEGDNIQRNLLDNITSFVADNLQYIQPWCRFDLPVTTLNLPSIVIIEGGAFGNNNITTLNLGSHIQTISADSFSNLDNVTINIALPAPDAGDTTWKSQAPWGATNATVNWTGTNS